MIKPLIDAYMSIILSESCTNISIMSIMLFLGRCPSLLTLHQTSDHPCQRKDLLDIVCQRAHTKHSNMINAQVLTFLNLKRAWYTFKSKLNFAPVSLSSVTVSSVFFKSILCLNQFLFLGLLWQERWHDAEQTAQIDTY